MKLPQAYLERIQKIFKEDTPAYLDSLEQGSVNSLLLNTTKADKEDFLSAFAFDLEDVGWCDTGFYAPRDADLSRHLYHSLGVYYLQEASAMAPASFLPVNKDDIVLDACAAPGGKSLKLSEKLKDGLLVSNDISASRQKATLRNLERAGRKNIYVSAMDLCDLAELFPLSFDKILLDAPCSGEGMFRKDTSLIRSWEEKGPDTYVSIQKELAEAAYKCLRPGGMLLYSTCTFEEAENEEVILSLLDNHTDLSLIPIEHPGFEKGHCGLAECARLYPHRIEGEGHFLALLKKEDASATEEPSLYEPVFDPSIEKFLQDPFFKDLKMPLNQNRLELLQDQLYLLPEKTLPKKGLRLLRSGLLLGESKKNGFEPSQALAMALRKEEYGNVVSLSSDDIRALKYLRGETVSVSQTEDGWYLVTIDGYAAGWAKITNGVFKNRIDKGWRLL